MFAGAYSCLVIAKHTQPDTRSLVLPPLSFSPMLGVIEVGIPVNSRTTHATMELSFLVGDAFIMVKVIGLGLYTMHTAQHPSIPSHKKKEKTPISPYF